MKEPTREMALEVVGAGLSAVALALPSLTFPMGPDQATLGVWAQQLARGAVPYRDVWDQRPPLLHLIHAAVYIAGIHGMLLTRVVDLVVQAGTAMALAALGYRLFGRGAGLLSGAMYAWCYFGQADYFHMSQPDGLPGVFLALAFLAVAREEGPGQRATLWAGAMVGLAFLAKYPAAVAFPVVLWAAPAQDSRARLHRAGLLALGALIPLAVFAIALGALGGLRDCWVATIVFNVGHQRLGAERPEVSLQALESLGQLLYRREVIAPLLLLPLAKAPRRGTRLGFGWLGAAALMVLAQRKFYSYHFLSLVPPLALLSAGAMKGMLARLREPVPARRKLVWGLALSLSLLAGWRTAIAWGRSAVTAIRVSREDQAREAFYRLHVNPQSGFSLGDHLDAARKLASLARPDDALFVLGGPLLYYLTELPPATRFIIAAPLLSMRRPAEYDREFEAELSHRRPTFVAIFREDHAAHLTGHSETSEQLVKLQPKLAQRLSEMELILELPTIALYGPRGQQ